MKTKFLLLILLASVQLNAQCNFETMWGFSTGITKFQASNIVLLNKNWNNFRIGASFWDSPAYLKDDSIYRTFASFNCMYSLCLGAYKNEVSLKFADDTLYEIDLKIDFTPSELDKCLQKYHEFLDSAKLTHPVAREYHQRSEETHEQNGVGYSLYRSAGDEHLKKLRKMVIGYEIVYERQWNEKTKKWHYSGNIEKYTLKISYIDLTHTKYDKRGY